MAGDDDGAAWPEWANGNAYTPFTELMALRRADGGGGTAKSEAAAAAAGPWTFLSRSPAYSPGGFTRAFGGHVYAQAALAAARTVRAGFVIHVRSSSLSPHTRLPLFGSRGPNPVTAPSSRKTEKG
jgi:hypothetical protein